MESDVQLERHVPKPSLFGLITSPGEQFSRIKDRPRFWGPLFIVSILSAIATALLTMTIPMDLEIEGIPAEQLEGFKLFGIIGAGLAGLFIPVITILITSAIYLLITTIAQTDAKFKQLLSMNTFIYFISVIGLLLHVAVRLSIGGDPEVNVTSLGSLVEAEGAAFTILNGIEVFSIWGMVLGAVGLQKVGGLSKGVAWTVAIVFFMIGILLGLMTQLF